MIRAVVWAVAATTTWLPVVAAETPLQKQRKANPVADAATQWLRDSLRLAYELSDGTRIAGTPNEFEVRIHVVADTKTELQSVPIETIRTIEALNDGESVAVTLRDDSQITGVLEAIPLELQTKRFGPQKFRMDEVTRITVDLGVRVERYDDADRFRARLKDSVRIVDFDDVDTADEDLVSFEPDRYRRKFGVVIEGVEGQFAGRTFGHADDFVPSSGPNSYAPGPTAPANAPAGSGGYETKVTFVAKDRPAMVCGFGAVFIDADYPNASPSSLLVCGPGGLVLDSVAGFRTRNGSGVFRGVITTDRSGRLVPFIHVARLINGGNWPSVEAADGVTLDDFTFSAPVPAETVFSDD